MSGRWKPSVRTLTVSAAIAAVTWACVEVSGGPRGQDSERQSLLSRLEAIQAATGTPAAAGAVFRSHEILEQAVVGVRKAGDPTPAAVDDVWHLASVGKAFTAMIAARLVERGELRWESTFSELLGTDLARAYASVTVAQLLGHRSGIPPHDLPPPPPDSSVAEQRALMARLLLETTPAGAPGEIFRYSNEGYAIMVVVLDHATGRSWEDLMRAEVFEPFGLASGSVGAPLSAGDVSHPLAHRREEDGTMTPVEPFGGGVMAPAAHLYMSVPDLVRWVQAHLRGERGEDGVVSAATFQRLHQMQAVDESNGYALGWREGAFGAGVVHHGGSVGLGRIVVGFHAGRDLGVVLVANGAGSGAQVNEHFRAIFEEAAAADGQPYKRDD